MKDKIYHFVHNLDLSAYLTVIGIILLFSGSIIVTLIAPNYVDPTWTMPSSQYQKQMFERSDPHYYISSAGTGGQELHQVHHLKNGETLLAFKETAVLKIKAAPGLENYVTKVDDQTLKLTSKLLLLRKIGSDKGLPIYELYDPKLEEAFSLATSDGILQDWVDSDFRIVEEKAPFFSDAGAIYVNNPIEFHYSVQNLDGRTRWKYDAEGKSVANLEELKSAPLSFSSRKELIEMGEHIYAIEGCWYCHTDQTRTLVQDLVANGSDSYPAPPSSPNEYIYQKITFPGTKRNGPDLSRVAVKRPSRDWHKAHFWSPMTASKGSIMPSFRHFFDFDPRGTSPLKPGVPNHRFEAVFQYLMTKGSRITAPTEAWWLGKDPIQTLEIIEGKKVLP
ncbi:MAG: cbb3-type cytochrome c oxidase subunit II [Parachlamydiaceae bacterium]